MNLLDLEYILNNDEITFYDTYTKKEFTNIGLRNFIRLFGYIPDQFKLVKTGEKTMAKAIKKEAKSTKAVKSAKPKAEAKKPAPKSAKKTKTK